MKKILAVLVLICVLCGCLVGFAACKKNKRADDVIYIRNLYFGTWSDFDDECTKWIENKFNVKFTDPANDVKPASYDFSSWTSQVNSDLMGDLPDVFEANIDSYNFNTTYVRWAKSGQIKALPDAVFDTNGRWSNLAKMLNSYADLEYLKYKGKLYGIPLARNVKQSDVPFAPFTYVYRRDVAQELHVYQENDVYTWEQFLDLLEAFSQYDSFKKNGAIGDSEWAYPSIMNFYKTASHCFAIDANGQVVNNYTTPEYLQGLAKTKELSAYYLSKQIDYSEKQNMVKEEYVSKNHIGVFYENLTMSNYLKILEKFRGDENKAAFMKVMGPDGKYALEEQEQWFSMSLINGNISDKKLESILDIMDWLLSDEGTMMALYGIEGQDYEIVNGEVSLIDAVGSLWRKGRDGEYTASAANNGARYLRYIVTLGNDLVDKDPIIHGSEQKAKAYNIIQAWTNEMTTAYNAGNLRVLGEDRRVKWMQTNNKQKYVSQLLSKANMTVLNYTLSKDSSTFGYDNYYLANMNSKEWQAVLKEINEELAK